MSDRRFSRRLLLMLTLSMACVVMAQTGDTHRRLHNKDYKREVEELEQQWRLATLNADVPALDKLLSDDYVGISMTGQVNTKAQQLDRLKSRGLLLTDLQLSDVKVKLVGSVAIVNGLADVKGTNDGVNMNGEYRYTRVYQRSLAGIWKITNFEVTRVPKALATGPGAEPGK